jgi:hypothetical protein
MPTKEKPPLSQQLLTRIMEKRIVAYAIVGAAIVGGVATFFGSVDKLLGAYDGLVRRFSESNASEQMALQRSPSLWIRLDALEVIDPSGLQAPVAKAGFFVRTPSLPPVQQAILDPLPLKVATANGAAPPPRKLPRLDPYAHYASVYIEQGLYELLDVEEVLMPNGRALLQRKGDKDRIVYLDRNNEVVPVEKAEHHKETWGRIQNLPKFAVK